MRSIYTIADREFRSLLTAPLGYVVMTFFLFVSGVFFWAPLQANVANAENTAVTWSVAEGNICGTVGPTGVYVAPAVRGLCHVSAASVVLPTANAVTSLQIFTGDISGDGAVDGEDMGLLAQDYGSSGSEETNLDAAGTVDDNDITLFVSQFGR